VLGIGTLAPDDTTVKTEALGFYLLFMKPVQPVLPTVKTTCKQKTIQEDPCLRPDVATPGG
jgi:hypothetical protein